MATTKLMTADDLMQIEDDGFLYELIRGELIRMSPAGGAHGWIGGEAAALIREFARPRGLGEVFNSDTGYLFEFDPDTVLAPDTSFIRADRLPPLSALGGYLTVVPDLVVEVASPSDRRGRIEEKVRQYLDAGVKLLWYVDPRRRTVVVYRPNTSPILVDEHGVLDGEDVLPGFRLLVAALFRCLAADV
ncbi:MAG: Uma2 family endonuclease [Thermomicrobiales bacterium]